MQVELELVQVVQVELEVLPSDLKMVELATVDLLMMYRGKDGAGEGGKDGGATVGSGKDADKGGAGDDADKGKPNTPEGPEDPSEAG